VTTENHDSYFQAVRAGARSEYSYGRLDAVRATKLPVTSDWRLKLVDDCYSWVLRASGQIASGTLLPSEELGVGGNATIRGYEERAANGDHGWIISNELRTPVWGVGRFLHGQELPNRVQALAFLDYGAVRQRTATTDDPKADLLSIGGGLRLWVSRNFSFRVDYGHQLRRETQLQLYSSHDRAHLGLELRY